MTRKIFAFSLNLLQLLGCLGLGVQAAENPAVTRVVSTFYGEGAQGFHWYTAENATAK